MTRRSMPRVRSWQAAPLASFSRPSRVPSVARMRSRISKRGSAGAELNGKMGCARSSKESAGPELAKATAPDRGPEGAPATRRGKEVGDTLDDLVADVHPVVFIHHAQLTDIDVKQSVGARAGSLCGQFCRGLSSDRPRRQQA